MQDHCHQDKAILAHSSTNLFQMLINLIHSIESSYNFKFKSHGATQVYIQHTEPLLKNVYLHLVLEVNISSDKLHEWMEQIYSSPDEKDYWTSTKAEQLKNDLKVTKLTSILQSIWHNARVN